MATTCSFDFNPWGFFFQNSTENYESRNTVSIFKKCFAGKSRNSLQNQMAEKDICVLFAIKKLNTCLYIMTIKTVLQSYFFRI